MVEWLLRLEPWQQALAGTAFTYFMTALGAGLVFFFKEIKKEVLNLMLGFASGVMIAASFWSLLDPAITKAEENGDIAWLVVSIGFGLGGVFLYMADKTLPHMHFGPQHEAEGLPTHLKRTILLVFSITLHNIPEGLAVGVAFGAAATADNPTAAILAAVSVALGIGIQNFPEGAAVSIPLRQEGLSRKKAFVYGQASGIVEPIAGVIGALLVTKVELLLPYDLCRGGRIDPRSTADIVQQTSFCSFWRHEWIYHYDDFGCGIRINKKIYMIYQIGSRTYIATLFF